MKNHLNFFILIILMSITNHINANEINEKALLNFKFRDVQTGKVVMPNKLIISEKDILLDKNLLKKTNLFSIRNLSY